MLAIRPGLAEAQGELSAALANPRIPSQTATASSEVTTDLEDQETGSVVERVRWELTFTAEGGLGIESPLSRERKGAHGGNRDVGTARELAGFRAEKGCAISLYLDLDPKNVPTAGDADARVSSLLVEGERHAGADGRGLTTTSESP